MTLRNFPAGAEGALCCGSMDVKRSVLINQLDPVQFDPHPERLWDLAGRSRKSQWGSKRTERGLRQSSDGLMNMLLGFSCINAECCQHVFWFEVENLQICTFNSYQLLTCVLFFSLNVKIKIKYLDSVQQLCASCTFCNPIPLIILITVGLLRMWGWYS